MDSVIYPISLEDIKNKMDELYGEDGSDEYNKLYEAITTLVRYGVVNKKLASDIWEYDAVLYEAHESQQEITEEE